MQRARIGQAEEGMRRALMSKDSVKVIIEDGV
jgi:hypothetical protein